MAEPRADSGGRLRRLAEELEEIGLPFDPASPADRVIIDEIDYAVRPAVHERRVPTYGALVDPRADPAGWERGTGLHISRRRFGGLETADARRFADGSSSWLLRRGDDLELAVFDRPASSERDIVVMVDAFDATVVQRHSSGIVRIADDRGVARWDGRSWHREPLVTRWIQVMAAQRGGSFERTFANLLAFAVHDLGVRLVASPVAISDVRGYRGMRHTSGRRYSFDQPDSIVIVVSEDGPVTVMQRGVILGRTDAQA